MVHNHSVIKHHARIFPFIRHSWLMSFCLIAPTQLQASKLINNLTFPSLLNFLHLHREGRHIYIYTSCTAVFHTGQGCHWQVSMSGTAPLMSYLFQLLTHSGLPFWRKYQLGISHFLLFLLISIELFMLLCYRLFPPRNPQMQLGKSACSCRFKDYWVRNLQAITSQNN